jgi:DNA invertase Pin-like site-specific DNA recombinase
MPAKSKPRTADGYVRVSRRAGREGESFISPEVQRQKIEGWAKLNEVEIVHWWEEIDQSGAKLERPLFQEALARCERGETGGIVVARLDRFARSAVDALESITRLNAADARLVSVEDNFDGSKPMGRFAIGILLLIAELELERIKENWQSAITNAVERGVHISARVPTGYRRDKNKRLVRDEPAASFVAEAFRRRALGASWTEIARLLEENEVYPATGNRHWSTTGIASLLRNRVYLGEARSGTVVNREAHEPLVTQAEFDAAQGGRTLLRQRAGSVASKALLGGLVRCAGCGHTLKIAGNTDKRTGMRYPVYHCTGRYAKGLCEARATIRASVLDAYVEEQILAALSEEGGFLAQANEASEAIDEGASRVAEAEHELDLFVGNPTLLRVLGEARFVEGVQVRQQALDEARLQLGTLRSQSLLTDDLPSGDLLKAWPELSLQDRRKLLHGLLERVVLRRAPARGPGALSVAERAQIVLRGNVLLEPNQPSRWYTSKRFPQGSAK